MRRNSKILVGLLAAAALSCGLLAGCSANSGDPTVELTPTLSSPTIIEDGVLTVGIDTTYPPFAAEADGKNVGIDVDVAAALATELGLELKLVNLANGDADEELANGTVDIVMNLEEVAGVNTKASKIAPYLYDAAAVFSTSATTMDLETLGAETIVAVARSLAAWTLEDYYPDSTSITTVSGLPSVFDTLSSGGTTYGAADVIRGGYLAATSYPDVNFVGYLTTPAPIYIGVAEGKTELASAITQAISNLESNGILQVIYTKWLGENLATQVLPASASTVTVTPPASSHADEEEEESEEGEGEDEGWY